MWWLLFKKRRQLPRATGPYVPGCTDVMIDHSPNGLFMSMYYPTDEIADETRYFPWLPNTDYLNGLAKVVMIHPLIMRFLMWYYSGTTILIPAIYGAKVGTLDKMKCIIFSPGLGTFRYIYSNICCEMASRGFLVICIEHRDNSACYTYYYESEEDAKNGIKKNIDFKVYNFGQMHYQKRNRQVHYRATECSRTVDFLIQVNNGVSYKNVIDDVPTKRKIYFKLSDLRNKISVDDFTMAGHSFGGATAILTMSKREILKQGILLDPWMFPIKNEKAVEDINQPVLFVNTETFHNEPNIKAMSKYLNGNHREIYTIKRTTHENHSDSVLVAGYWLNWFMKKLNPLIALRINNNLMLRFLCKHTGFSANGDFQIYLENKSNNFEDGLTQPWA